MNLCGNALKYTRYGYVYVKLVCDTEPDERGERNSAQITLTVADSGRGISPEYLRDNLYQPFQQENPHAPGTGLGLSIVRQIVNTLGGTIDIKSEKNVGTEVVVKLKLEPAKIATEEEDQSSRRDIDNLGKATKGWSVSFVGLGITSKVVSTEQPASPSDKGILLLKTSISKICTEWYGMSVVEDWSEDMQPSLFFTTLDGLNQLRKKIHPRRGGRSTPTIVLCHDARSASAFTKRSMSEAADELEEAIAEP